MKSQSAQPEINLDAAAAMPMLPGFIERYGEYLRQYEVNPHGVTCYSARCRQALELAARKLLCMAGTSDDCYRVIWCASATEAVNIALRSSCRKDSRVLLDAGGHPALRNTVKALHPAETVFTTESGGALQIPDDAARCDLAALTLVNSENGRIWDGKRQGLPPSCRIILDASQGFALHPVPWLSARPDLVIFSAHKMGAAGNTAALIYRKDIQPFPVFTGGGQQNGIRPGTIHVPGCLLMADAAEWLRTHRENLQEQHRELNRRLRDGIAALGHGEWPVFSPEDGSPSILFFAIPGYEGALVARILAEQYHILVGTGSACSAESSETSPLLASMGIPRELSRCALRISLHHSSTPADIETFLHALPPLLQDF